MAIRGRFPFLVAPAVLLLVVWLSIGLGEGTWDVESLVMAVGWVLVAQIALLAHMRRSGSVDGATADRPTDAISRSVISNRRGLAVVPGVILLLVLLATLGGVIPPAPAVVLLGVTASLFAAVEIIAWSNGTRAFPWTATAIGSGGVGLFLCQLPPGDGFFGQARVGAIVLGIGAAGCIWLGTLARDLRELTS